MMDKAKAIAAAIGMVITALTAILADNVFDANEAGVLLTVLIEAAVAVWAVWAVPNAGFVKTGAKPQTRN